MTRPRWIEWVAGVGLVVLAFAFLGTRGLNEPDEGRYAEIAREMAASGDWVTPRLDGIEHFQKPPLLYWATVGGMRVLGENEWGARLPSALAALGTLWLTALIAAALFDRRAGVIAAGVLATSAEFFWLARTLTPDMLLTFWTTAAVLCLVRWVQGDGRARWQWGFFAAVGLGFLAKGPMAAVVPVAAALACAGTGSSRWSWGGGIVLALAIGLSWFVVVSTEHPELVRYFVEYELVDRVATHVHGRVKPVWFFAPVLVAGLLPWTFFAPALAGRLWQRLRSGQLAVTHRLLLGWTIPPLVVLSLSGSKLATYVLPLFPAYAVALAGWWRRHASGRAAGRALGTSYGALALVAGVLVAASLPAARGAVAAVLGCAVCVVAAVALWWATRRARERALAVVAVATGLLLVVSSRQAVPLNDVLGRQASVRPIVDVLERQPGVAAADMFKCGVRADGYEFYLRRLVSTTASDADVVLPPDAAQRELLIPSRDDCERVFHARHPAYGLVRTHRFEKTFARSGWRVLARAGDFLLIADPASAQAATLTTTSRRE